MVLMMDKRLPLKRKLGRITEVFRSLDGNIRVVVVRTSTGAFRRAISKIHVLLIRNNVAPTGGASVPADVHVFEFMNI